MRRIVDPLTEMGAVINLQEDGTAPLQISGVEPVKNYPLY